MAVVCFATFADRPDPTEEDRLAAEALERMGIRVAAAVWDDPRVGWDSFDRVIVRSTWDYHLKADRYREWIGGFAASPGRLWNPPEVLLENLDKQYLIDLARRGFSVVPTRLVPAGETTDLAALMAEEGWPAAVIKPAVSGGAWETWLADGSAAAAGGERFRREAALRSLLVQPLMPEVAAEGEWSLVFFERRFSHAALKRPGPGDFRTQRRFGGSFAPADPPQWLVGEAAEILNAVAAPLLYARVDGIAREGRFVLMELEVNEPQLFLGCHPQAPGRFARAIRDRL